MDPRYGRTGGRAGRRTDGRTDGRTRRDGLPRPRPVREAPVRLRQLLAERRAAEALPQHAPGPREAARGNPRRRAGFSFGRPTPVEWYSSRRSARGVQSLAPTRPMTTMHVSCNWGSLASALLNREFEEAAEASAESWHASHIKHIRHETYKTYKTYKPNTTHKQVLTRFKDSAPNGIPPNTCSTCWVHLTWFWKPRQNHGLRCPAREPRRSEVIFKLDEFLENSKMSKREAAGSARL